MPTPVPAQVAQALAELLSWSAPQRAELVDRVAAAAERPRPTSRPGTRARPPRAYRVAVRLTDDYPGDIGVVCSLLMHHRVLEPGQALFMAPGGLHAYLRGTGVELLANSDNVIRAGLTPKHIDVPELLRILDPAVPVPVQSARRTGPGVEAFDTPVPEFLLRRLTVRGEGAQDAVADSVASLTVPGAGTPRILFCVEGAVELVAERSAAIQSADPSGGASTLRLNRGQSCFLSAAEADAAVALSVAPGAGSAVVFLASPGA